MAVYCADGDASPQIVHSPAHALGRWTRREIAEWLVKQLQQQDIPTLVGIDHSFPIRYFERYPEAVGDWDHFLNDFQRFWRNCSRLRGRKRFAVEIPCLVVPPQESE